MGREFVFRLIFELEFSLFFILNRFLVEVECWSFKKENNELFCLLFSALMKVSTVC